MEGAEVELRRETAPVLTVFWCPEEVGSDNKTREDVELKKLSSE